MSPPQFDWSDETDLAVREQMATAIYFNEGGDVVVRQRDFYDEDGIIVLTRDSARTLALALLRLVDADGSVPIATAPPKDPTAATRQRRHRDKHRDTDRDSHAETVTPEHHSETPPLQLKAVA